MTEQAVRAAAMFELTLDWFKDHYDDHEYWNEFDVASALWDHLRRQNVEQGRPFSIRCQYRTDKGNSSPVFDLAIVSREGAVLVLVEVKFERCPTRTNVLRKHGRGHIFPDTRPPKNPQTDIEKIEAAINASKAEIAYSVFVDEGSEHFEERKPKAPPAGSQWLRWGISPTSRYDVSILLGTFPAKEVASPKSGM